MRWQDESVLLVHAKAAAAVEMPAPAAVGPPPGVRRSDGAALGSRRGLRDRRSSADDYLPPRGVLGRPGARCGARSANVYVLLHGAAWLACRCNLQYACAGVCALAAWQHMAWRVASFSGRCGSCMCSGSARCAAGSGGAAALTAVSGCLCRRAGDTIDDASLARIAEGRRRLTRATAALASQLPPPQGAAAAYSDGS